eukprot:CAMPEP_0114489450 /NCGR_PEP_ID=MMETSP0109-20121206/1898_1 /TAXON_ID=29199 /ORGANISM="Chlorarachnion reptans, Strain CCCM449" /LENGTH=241 /DNA_ID=CAMNT_0001665967 /DNA_START=107 /DNA_END=832 /DNA_ORIENTATION=-
MSTSLDSPVRVPVSPSVATVAAGLIGVLAFLAADDVAASTILWSNVLTAAFVLIAIRRGRAEERRASLAADTKPKTNGRVCCGGKGNGGGGSNGGCGTEPLVAEKEMAWCASETNDKETRGTADPCSEAPTENARGPGLGRHYEEEAVMPCGHTCSSCPTRHDCPIVHARDHKSADKNSTGADEVKSSGCGNVDVEELGSTVAAAACSRTRPRQVGHDANQRCSVAAKIGSISPRKRMRVR